MSTCWKWIGPRHLYRKHTRRYFGGCRQSQNWIQEAVAWRPASTVSSGTSSTELLERVAQAARLNRPQKQFLPSPFIRCLDPNQQGGVPAASAVDPWPLNGPREFSWISTGPIITNAFTVG